MVFGKIKGYKTILVSILVTALGFWEFAISENGLLQYICDDFGVMCDYESSTFYGAIITIVGIINAALRMVTTTPIGASEATEAE